MRILPLAFALIILSSSAYAIPQLIDFQGKLADSLNVAQTGVFTMHFAIYNQSSGGTLLWQENKSVAVSNGLFTTLLGSTNPINTTFAEDYFVEINVSGEVFTPRYRLTSVPYAFRANISESAMSTSINSPSFVIRRIPGQTANLTEWRNFSGNVLSYVNSDGQFVGDGSRLTNVGIANATQNLSAANISAGIFGADVDGTDSYIFPQNLTILRNLSIGNIFFASTLLNFIGIGTATPQYRLDVNGTINAHSFFINGTSVLNGTVTGSGTTGYIPQFQAPGILNNSAIYQNGTNIGIGTTSPQSRLEVGANSGTSVDEKLSVRSQGRSGIELLSDTANSGGEPGGAYVLFSQDGNTVQGIIGTVQADNQDPLGSTYSGTSQNGILVSNNFSGVVQLGTAGAVRMTVGASGNIGIGTNSPRSLLEVFGSGSVVSQITSTNNDARLLLSAQGAGGRDWYIQTGNTGSGLSGAFRIFDVNASASRLLIDTSGNIGIGTTSPAALLHINSSSSAGSLRIENTTGSLILSTNGTSGSVGIGTLNPGAKLEIFGNGSNLRLTHNAAAQYADIYLDSVGNLNINTISGVNRIGNQLATYLQYYALAENGQIGWTQFTNNAYAGVFDTGIARTSAGLLEVNNGNKGVLRDLRLRALEINGTNPANNLSLNVSGVLYVNNSANNVGIGTSMPGYKLDVAGSINAHSLLVNGTPFVGGGSSNSGGWTNTSTQTYTPLDVNISGNIYLNGSLFFGDGGGQGGTPAGNVSGGGAENYTARWSGVSTLTSGIIYDNGASIGIGTSSPARIFTINGAGASLGNSRVLLQTPFSGSTIGDGFDIISYNATGNAAVWNYENGNLSFATNNNERMVILSDGNVGIGTSNPGTYKLKVNGGAVSIDAGASGAQDLLIADLSGVRAAELKTDASGHATLNLRNGTGVQKVLISAEGDTYFRGGNVGIGRVSPSYMLDVNGTLNAHALLINGTPFSITNNITASGTAGYIPQFQNASTLNISVIYQNGTNIGIGTTSVIGNFHVSFNSSANATSSPNQFLVDNVNTDWDTGSLIKFTSRNAVGSVIGGAAIGAQFKARTDGQENADLLFVTRTAGSMTEKMRITAAGNVGIGTSSPSTKLHIRDGAITLNASTANTVDYFVGSGANNNIRWDASHGTIVSSSAETVINIDSDDDDTTRYFAIQSNTVNRNTSREILRVQENGNVGIGTTSPTVELQIGAGPLLTVSGKIGGTTDVQQIISSTTENETLGLQLQVNASGRNSRVELFMTDAPEGSGAWGLHQTYTSGGAQPFVIDSSGIERFRISTTGNVGIGTASPGGVLHLNGSSNQLVISTTVTDARIQLAANATNSAMVNYHTSSGLTVGTQSTAATKTVSLQTSGTDRLIIDGNGNVGIATATPSTRLSVNASGITSYQKGNGTLLLQVPYSSGVINSIDFKHEVASQFEPVARIAVNHTSAGSFMMLGTSNNYGLGITNHGLVIDNNGNIGIGTPTPSYNLHIGNSTGQRILQLAGGNTAHQGQVISLLSSGSREGFIAQTNTNGALFIGNSAGLGGNYNDTNLANNANIAITSSGNIGIGTTSPDRKFVIEQSANASGALIYNTLDGGYTGSVFVIDSYSNRSSNFGLLQVRTDADNDGNGVQTHLYVSGSGNVGIGTTSPTSALHVAGDVNVTGTSYLANLNIAGVTMSNGNIHTTGSVNAAGNISANGSIWQPVYPSDDALVAYLPFDEGSGGVTYDKSPYGLVANLTNMNTSYNGLNGTHPSGWTAGKYGNAVAFDRGDDRVTVGSILTGENISFTAMAWIKTTEVTSAWKTVFGEGCTGFVLTVNIATLTYGRNCGQGSGFVSSGVAISANTWYHVALTGNGSSLTLHVNGVAVSNTTNHTILHTGTTFFIGDYATGSTEQFNGTIDEVRVYNRTLANEEIRTQYLGGLQSQGYIRANNFRIINTTNGEVFRITSEGRVGIGSTSPAVKLHVNDTSASNSAIALDGSNTGSPYVSFRQQGNERAFIQYTEGGGSSDYLNYATSASAPHYFSGGNVGIGTLIAGVPLVVNRSSGMIANFTTSTAGTGHIAVTDLAQASVGMGISTDALGTHGFLGTISSTNLIFRTANAERMRIDTSGNVGIGILSPSAVLHVNSSVNGVYLLVNASTTPSTSLFEFWAGGNPYLAGKSGNVGVGTVNPTQKLHVSGNTNVTGNIYYGGNLTGYGADFAEMMKTKGTVEYGDVVCLNDDMSVSKCTSRAQSSVAGIASPAPTIIGNAGNGGVAVGIVGIVKTKVTGKINRFDMLTTSDKDGYAEKATVNDFGSIIGKAMEPCNGGECTISVLVGLR